MRDFRERLGKEWLLWDGGTGTLLQRMGLSPGELPETWNIKHPDKIVSLHRDYFASGSDIVNANTFGANALKFPEDLEEIVRAGVENAIRARELAGREDVYVALDIGPLGRLIAPVGDLPFEEAVEIFARTVKAGAAAGADLVLIETMTDSCEARAALLAAKENCALPVCVTCTFDEVGRLMTGGSPASFSAMMEGLGADAIGLNCGLGPVQLYPLVREMLDSASLPLIVNPNAGLPRQEEGRLVYDLNPSSFCDAMEKIAGLGVQVMGGCCGTTPEHIALLTERIKKLPFREAVKKNRTVISSFSHALEIGNEPLIIGERINPTGKKRFKHALINGDLEYILGEALSQEEKGAQVLDVNVGLPEIDEADMMEKVISQIQSICPLPLQIDSADPLTLERGLRIYNGKAMINSVNGREESMAKVFPLAKKYGAVVVALCLDEKGIPETANGRLEIAKRIVQRAEDYGIDRSDIIVDGLCLTISSEEKGALTTLETIDLCHRELGLKTILGVSNISFGLPMREIINGHFLSMALAGGLSCAIINPGSTEMMKAWRASLALLGKDPQCGKYIAACEGFREAVPQPVKAGSGAAAPHPGDSIRTEAEKGPASPLEDCVYRGLCRQAGEAAREALKEMEASEVIDRLLIPSLDRVGRGFEKGEIYLPQLLMSADAAKEAFRVIKESFGENKGSIRGRVILATVKNDIHDIGKNIVKVMLENYGYEVLDLGRDVPPEDIVRAAVENDIKLVGLSALMTTTVPSMEESIALLHREKPDCRIVVGGAVMTQDYADSIGADHYARDAMATVRYADQIFGSR